MDTSAAGSHTHTVDAYTKAEIDALLAGYARVDHTHDALPPEPDPVGTWLRSDAYPSWQHALEALSVWQQNGHEMAGLLITKDDVRNYPIHVPPLRDLVIQAPDRMVFVSRSTHFEGSTFRLWLPERVRVRRLLSWGPHADFPPDDNDMSGLSDACGFKVDGGTDTIFEDCISRNHFCAGVWFTANDPYQGHPASARASSGCQWIRGKSLHNVKDGYHASHGAVGCASIDSISQFGAEDGHSCSAEPDPWGNGINNTLVGCTSRDLSRASCFTVEGQTGFRGERLTAVCDRANRTALLRMGTNASYPGGRLFDAELSGFDFRVLRQDEPHAVINLTAGAGDCDLVTLRDGRIQIGEAGSAPVIRVHAYAPHRITRVRLEAIHVTGPAGLDFLATNVRDQIEIAGCTLNGEPVN